MVAVTTVLGMIPLLQDPFFAAIAVAIMFGLSFALRVDDVRHARAVSHLLRHPLGGSPSSFTINLNRRPAMP
jgi:hypothetical protein